MEDKDLAEFLLEYGFVNEEQIESAYRMQEALPEKMTLGQILVRDGTVTIRALKTIHAAYARRDDRPGARRRLSLVAAGLERDDHRRPGGPAPRNPQRLDLRVRPAEPPVPAFANDLRAPHHHAPDHRVRLHVPPPPRGQLQGPLHVPAIELGLVHGWEWRVASGEW